MCTRLPPSLSNEENAGNVTLFDAAMIPLGETALLQFPQAQTEGEVRGLQHQTYGIQKNSLTDIPIGHFH